MSDEVKEINIIELLLKISNDVSSIKTDMINFKETQKSDKESITKEIADIRFDYERDIKDLNNKIMNKLQTLQSVQNTLVGDVDTLKHAEEKKEAKRYRTVIAFVITALGGMVLAKLPDFIIYLIKIKG